MAKVTVTLIGQDYGFEAKDENQLKVRYDNAVSGGGKQFGVSPMQGLLMSLGGCTGIDTVLILKKKRQEISFFEIEITGHRVDNKVPSLWEKAHLIFVLKGNIEETKAIRAIEMSIQNYCPVAETLRRAGCSISWELKLNLD